MSEKSRREFIKKVALGAAAVGAAGAGCSTPQVEGEMTNPDPSFQPGQANRLRLSMARTDLPVGVWDDVVALTKLTEDVFGDRGLAARFSGNPEAYLKSIGLGHVKLELGATEVRLALAMGDPGLREMVANGEYHQFINRLGEMGLLDPTTRSPLARRVADELGRSLGLPAGRPSAMMGVFPVFALLVVVAVTWVAVGYSVYAGMMVRTYAALSTEVAVTARANPKGLIGHVPGLSLAGAMGGDEAARRAAEVYLDSTADSVVGLLEGAAAFAERNTMSTAELRAVVRETMSLQLALPPMSRWRRAWKWSGSKLPGTRG